MKLLAFTLGALVAATALAGCTQPPPPTPQGGTATSVRVLDGFPATVAPNSNATVCWRVEGTGTVPHTAIHFDNASHPGTNVTFTAYAGTAYPNNASAAQPMQLPGDFCTRVPVGNGTVYFRAHVIDGRGGTGMVSDERRIEVRSSVVPPGVPPQGTVLTVSWEAFNATAPAGTNVTACWTVRGTGTIPHTAIHTDNASRPATANFTAYAGPAFYPNNRTAADAAGYNVTATGSTFCTAIPVPATGTLYMRAHAMVSAPGTLTLDERTLRAG